MKPTITTCRSCGAKIFYARHEFTGNPAPLDAEPTPSGNIAFREETGTWGIVPAQGRVMPLYTNHFATCPNAATHRAPQAKRSTR